MWVKICGNTRLEDCLLAAEFGANAVGFVFAEGKRTVTAEHIAPIVKQLPPGLESIGVFNAGSPAAIAYAVQKAHLTGLQLHRAYEPSVIQRMHAYLDGNPRPRVLQVVSWRVDEPAEQQASALAKTLHAIETDGLVDAVLLDSSTAGASGGTGRTFDWTAASAVLRNMRLPLILAGGLKPENVSQGVHTLSPQGVDVASGVEESPGVKDAEKMRHFIVNARAALTK